MSLVSEVLRRSLNPYVIISNPPSDRIGMLGSFRSEKEQKAERSGGLWLDLFFEEGEDKEKSIWRSSPQGHRVSEPC